MATHVNSTADVPACKADDKATLMRMLDVASRTQCVLVETLQERQKQIEELVRCSEQDAVELQRLQDNEQRMEREISLLRCELQELEELRGKQCCTCQPSTDASASGAEQSDASGASASAPKECSTDAQKILSGLPSAEELRRQSTVGKDKKYEEWEQKLAECIDNEVKQAVNAGRTSAKIPMAVSDNEAMEVYDNIIDRVIAPVRAKGIKVKVTQWMSETSRLIKMSW